MATLFANAVQKSVAGRSSVADGGRSFYAHAQKKTNEDETHTNDSEVEVVGQVTQLCRKARQLT